MASRPPLPSHAVVAAMRSSVPQFPFAFAMQVSMKKTLLARPNWLSYGPSDQRQHGRALRSPVPWSARPCEGLAPSAVGYRPKSLSMHPFTARRCPRNPHYEKRIHDKSPPSGSPLWSAFTKPGPSAENAARFGEWSTVHDSWDGRVQVVFCRWKTSMAATFRRAGWPSAAGPLDFHWARLPDSPSLPCLPLQATRPGSCPLNWPPKLLPPRPK
jgi:hypothetical protein